MRKYDALLVDADGTILDFAAAEDKALIQACRAMELEIDDAQAAEYKRINEDLWRAFERQEVTQDALRTLRFTRFFDWLGVQRDAAEMAEHYVEGLSQQTDEIEGADAFLREVARRMPIVVVTNGIASVQRSRFAKSPLGAYLNGHVISGEMGFAKPDPRMIGAALDIAAVPAGRALMLGDEPRSDIAAANAAGVDSCWYNPEGRENTTAHEPTYEVRTLAEVLQWL